MANERLRTVYDAGRKLWNKVGIGGVKMDLAG